MLLMEEMVMALPSLPPLARLLEKFGQQAGDTSHSYLRGGHHHVAHLQEGWS